MLGKIVKTKQTKTLVFIRVRVIHRITFVCITFKMCVCVFDLHLFYVFMYFMLQCCLVHVYRIVLVLMLFRGCVDNTVLCHCDIIGYGCCRGQFWWTLRHLPHVYMTHKTLFTWLRILAPAEIKIIYLIKILSSCVILESFVESIKTARVRTCRQKE